MFHKLIVTFALMGCGLALYPEKDDISGVKVDFRNLTVKPNFDSSNLTVIDAKDQYPMLDYLGYQDFPFYGRRFYYIDRTARTQTSSRSACHSQGMVLFMPIFAQELDWVSRTLQSTDGTPWTDARLFRNLEAFVYDQQCNAGICYPLTSGFVDVVWSDLVGLTIDRPNNRLRLTYSSTAKYALCTTPF